MTKFNFTKKKLFSYQNHNLDHVYQQYVRGTWGIAFGFKSYITEENKSLLEAARIYDNFKIFAVLGLGILKTNTKYKPKKHVLTLVIRDMFASSLALANYKKEPLSNFKLEDIKPFSKDHMEITAWVV